MHGTPRRQQQDRNLAPRGRPASAVAVIKRLAKQVLLTSGSVNLVRAASSGPPTFATILRYHSVSEDGDYRSPTIAVSPSAFDRQMGYLAKHYSVLPLGELLSRVVAGEIPRNAVAITFDDGYRDNVEIALPILRSHGLTATFFVTSDAVLGQGAFWVGWLWQAVATASASRRHRALQEVTGHCDDELSAEAAFAAIAHRVDTANGEARSLLFAALPSCFPDAPPLDAPSSFMMGAADLRRLRDMGMTVGAHTATHRILAGAPEAESAAEVIRSKRDLEAALGVPVEHFAYPNGHVEENVDRPARAIVAAAGFRSAGTSRRGVVSRESDLFDLPRQGVNDRLGFAGFVFKLEEQRLRFLVRAEG